MAIFGRKQNSVLPEVDQYYEGERKDRAGLAWLLALVSVAVVALVLIGAFLGGRWIYRQATGNDDKGTVAVVNEGDLPSFDGSTEDQPATTPAPAEEGRVDAPAQTTTPSTPASATPTTPASDLPNTGSADTLAIFAVVSLLAGILHNAVTRRQEV